MPRRSGRLVEIWSSCVRMPGVMVRRGVCPGALRGLVLWPQQAVLLRFRRLNRCCPCKVLVARQSYRRRASGALEACPSETSSNAVLCCCCFVAWPGYQREDLVVVPEVAGRPGQECVSWLWVAQVQGEQVILG